VTELTNVDGTIMLMIFARKNLVVIKIMTKCYWSWGSLFETSCRRLV